MSSPKVKYSARHLTKCLRALAADPTIDDEGNPTTRAEKLARLLWKKALGGENPKTGEFEPPAAWAIQLIYERMEGKAPAALSDDSGKMTVAERVRELAVQRVNSLSEAIAAIPDSKGPVERPDNGNQDSEGPDEESGMAQ